MLPSKITQDNYIQGINVFQKELKINQFADDFTLLNSNRNCVSRPLRFKTKPVETQGFVAWTLETL